MIAGSPRLVGNPPARASLFRREQPKPDPALEEHAGAPVVDVAPQGADARRPRAGCSASTRRRSNLGGAARPTAASPMLSLFVPSASPRSPSSPTKSVPSGGSARPSPSLRSVEATTVDVFHLDGPVNPIPPPPLARLGGNQLPRRNLHRRVPRPASSPPSRRHRRRPRRAGGGQAVELPDRGARARGGRGLVQHRRARARETTRSSADVTCFEQEVTLLIASGTAAHPNLVRYVGHGFSAMGRRASAASSRWSSSTARPPRRARAPLADAHPARGERRARLALQLARASRTSTRTRSSIATSSCRTCSAAVPTASPPRSSSSTSASRSACRVRPPPASPRFRHRSASASTGTWRPRCAQAVRHGRRRVRVRRVVHRLLWYAAPPSPASQAAPRQGQVGRRPLQLPRPRRSSARLPTVGPRWPPPSPTSYVLRRGRPRRAADEQWRSSPSSSRHLRRRHPRYVDLKLRVPPREAAVHLPSVFLDHKHSHNSSRLASHPHKTRQTHPDRAYVCRPVASKNAS